jgi:hypothetical protein
MTIAVTNTAGTDTFLYWQTRTNELADALTNKVITADSNTTSGNVTIDGIITVGNSTVNSIVNSSTVTSTHFDNVSDISLKDDIFSLCITDTDMVLELNPVSFTWKSDDNNTTNYGFIAQEVEQVIPDIVTKQDSGIKTVSYIQLVPLLLAALQNQQKQLNELKSLIINKDMS